MPEIAEQNFTFMDQGGEFDDAFIFENLIVLIEYTSTQSNGISDHLKHKKIIYRRILDNQKDFINFLKVRFPKFVDRLGATYHEDRLMVKIVYCSMNSFDEAIKLVVDEPAYLDFPILKYFEKITSAIKISAQHEVLAFLGVDPIDVGSAGKFAKKDSLENYAGSILPEEASGFPAGYKVVSFYADAASLLQRAFVLRRSGWRGSQEAYQRMVIQSKIEAIRAKLKDKGQVAVNNIIATLPSDVLPVGSDGKTIEISKLTKTEPVKISLPLRANSIGLIDGQHRLFSYYKSREDDPKIALLREQQNLLVTGIIYPDKLKPAEAERFEAGLFLSINSNQSSAPANLRQEIEVLLNPFSHTAISKQVMERISATGPLAGHVEQYFFDKGKLKTSSVVSFGLGPLLKLSGNDSIFSVFTHPEKEGISEGSSKVALDAYINHSATLINILLSAVKSNVSQDRWTTDKRVKNRLLTVTYVNSFLITLRMLISNGAEISFDSLRPKFAGIGDFDTRGFHSSQYNRMAEKIFETYLK